MTIIDVIKKFRYKQHLSQTEVASQLEINKATYCNYEKGRAKPIMAVRRKMFDISNEKNLGFTEEDIFGVQD